MKNLVISGYPYLCEKKYGKAYDRLKEKFNIYKETESVNLVKDIAQIKESNICVFFVSPSDDGDGFINEILLGVALASDKNNVYIVILDYEGYDDKILDIIVKPIKDKYKHPKIKYILNFTYLINELCG